MSSLASLLSDERKEAISRSVIFARLLLHENHQDASNEWEERRKNTSTAMHTFLQWDAESFAEVSALFGKSHTCDHPTCVQARTAGPFMLYTALIAQTNYTEDRSVALCVPGESLIRWAAEGDLSHNWRTAQWARAIYDPGIARNLLANEDLLSVTSLTSFEASYVATEKLREVDNAFTANERQQTRQNQTRRSANQYIDCMVDSSSSSIQYLTGNTLRSFNTSVTSGAAWCRETPRHFKVVPR